MTTEDRINDLIKLASSIIGQRERFEHTCRAISVPVPEFREHVLFEVRPIRDQLRGMMVAVNAAPEPMGGLALDDTLSDWEAKLNEQYDRDCNTLSNHLCSFYSDIRADGAHVPHGSGKGEANARLIAAAPDLLAALRGLADWTSHDTRTWGECVEAAREAITKAEG